MTSLLEINHHGTTKQLHEFYDEINKINPTMKFTINHISVEGEEANYKCDCESKTKIPFLDTWCYIKNGKIETDLYKKDHIKVP